MKKRSIFEINLSLIPLKLPRNDKYLFKSKLDSEASEEDTSVPAKASSISFSSSVISEASEAESLDSVSSVDSTVLSSIDSSLTVGSSVVVSSTEDSSDSKSEPQIAHETSLPSSSSYWQTGQTFINCLQNDGLKCYLKKIYTINEYDYSCKKVNFK